MIAEKTGIDAGVIGFVRNALFETTGDVVIVCGSDLSADAQAIIAASAGRFAGEGRRVLLHPLPLYNNSVGAIDIIGGGRTEAEAIKQAKAAYVAGSLQDTSLLKDKEFVAVQELFETETTAYADVVFPAASFAEVDGTFTNNAGNVQRVRKAIDPVNQSKPDWMIAALIAREMGADLGYELSATALFKAVADAVPAYEGIRYPALKDESEPVQAKYEVKDRDVSGSVERIKNAVESMSAGEKNNEVPKIGHKLHRLTTMTSKTAQFHLLANGNPKPENLLLSPLVQIEPNGKKKEIAATVSAGDRE